ncbi:MAG: Zinc phosphodiesterase ELAC protein 2 [Geoglossum umbratile]|nr:MAG: Zinc phosphodiesterase ELAC protein 2 [Geoglossum umbratile]
MRAHVEFITTPTADTPGTTLLLHFDKKRYLIGSVAEGTQRAIMQRGAKLTKVSDIFLTGKMEWANTGGLIGMILSLADVVTTQAEDAIRIAREKAERLLVREQRANGGDQVNEKLGESAAAFEKPTLTIHGGTNLTHTLATARRFVFRKGMAVELDEFEGRNTQAASRDGKSEPTFTDENVKVWAMTILPSDLSGDVSPTSGTSKGLGKRSFGLVDEVQTDESSLGRSGGLTDAERGRGNLMRKAVVSEMFNSEWRLDHLVEMPLSEVDMPAAIFIRDPETGRIREYAGPMPPEVKPSEGPISPVNDINVLVRQPWPGALIRELPPTSPSREALSYVIKTHPQRGKFLPDRAKALGVEEGPKWASLAMGICVEAVDGSIVTPEMVLGEGSEGTGFAVVDLPSEGYVDGLVKSEEWKIETIMNGVNAIVWILGPGVSKDERLKRFVSKMSHINHIVSSPDHCPNYLALDSSASATIQLFKLDPLRFQLPIHDNAKVPQVETSTTDTQGKPSPFQAAERGKRIQLQPRLEVQDKYVVPPLNTAVAWKSVSPEVERLAQDAENELRDERMQQEIARQQEGIPGMDVEIITLGTGSSLPSKYRNVSATLVRVPGIGSYLFDCGENTLGQLRRMFRAEQVLEILRDLKAIWISHLHADHHLGITSVIKAWYEEVWGNGKQARPQGESIRHPQDCLKVLREEKRLFVLSEYAMIKWLKEYASVEDYGFDKLVPLAVLSAKPWMGVSSKMGWGDILITPNAEAEEGLRELGVALVSAMGVSDVQAVDVDHCRGSKAVSFTFPSGFKFSYSGDCRPSREFAVIGKDSTVLLHEATFDDELQGDAKAKKHSTTSEALGVGVAMGARRVILTHFSQRYQKIPVMDAVEGQDLGIDAAGEISATTDAAESDPSMDVSSQASLVKIKNPASVDMKIGIAFDFMRVKVGEIIHLERFTPALIKHYEQQEEAGGNFRRDRREVQVDNQRTKKPKQEPKARKAKTKHDKIQSDR